MPEGRVRLNLSQPGRQTQDEFGDTTTAIILHTARAVRRDRVGGEVTIPGFVTTGLWSREYEIRDAGEVTKVDTGWFVQDVDDFGRVFAVESVQKPPGRVRKLILRCTRHAP